ncbi:MULTISPECIES: MerR family transcriptional regulator [Thalassobaculum]|uniref:MerR HTH family regulatory protein n=1 Tax=Thalassobaculum litoreum DSM 18839 TaxID=1123362 RepID=A0A8G2BE79_9PROT|nr:MULTISPECIES: MerR family transcriptional regulator [Thalassobaculum]SDF10812.1 MerR HTH family regulatory protein [Thalassobaculum litoreum DSM 18839]
MADTQATSSAPRRNGKSAAAFRTISEVADDLDVPPHVLRFWETKFNQVRPLKRGGGRRYYRPEDIALLRRIRELLYREGYTIKGVQKLLREGAVRMPTAGETARAVQSGDAEGAPAPSNGNGNGNGNGGSHEPMASGEEPGAPASVDRAAVKAVLDELTALKKLLAAART